MSRLEWYWHRLRAMSPGEVALHARKKLRQFADARRERDWAAVKLESSGAFPKLPQPDQAPQALRDALKKDTQNILAGRWKAFGHLDLKVDDPPKWHCDYLVGQDFATSQSAFKLDHRALPGGGDIKLIWELSRWYQLVRLAMAAYVLGDERAARKCIAWLEDWVKRNPPYVGWNWTSALEAGIRLVQFTWIDALLTNRAQAWGFDAELETLRYEILPPHAWYVWRNLSFGSSANNHLIGELAGLIVATVRWPPLVQWSAPLDKLRRRWQREVLEQFESDGGNREQALNYHLFSWEFCWQAWEALGAVWRKVWPLVSVRLTLAARFFSEVQVPTDAWDYGDSDNGYVTPLFAEESTAMQEWCGWLNSAASGAALEYWWGAAPRDFGVQRSEPDTRPPPWREFSFSGYGVWTDGRWTLRWDASRLGYLKTAAHGHLDALHLSIWRDGVALVIDPGTGCYFADPVLRAWLAGRAAHNGPTPAAPFRPRRLGVFLWSKPHERIFPILGAEMWDQERREDLLRALPELARDLELTMVELTMEDLEAERDHAKVWADNFIVLGGRLLDRRLRLRDDTGELQVDDWVYDTHRARIGGKPGAFTVRWQFAPGATLETLGERRFLVRRKGVRLEVQVSPDWADVLAVADKSQVAQADPENPLAGTVSPAFRKTLWAPYLKLVARPSDKPCLFRTTFLASPSP
jgi:hypothetical protein